MDERERRQIRKEFQSLKCDLIIHTLSIGDYLLSPEHIIERKRGDDFVSSIYDHRLFQQLKQMKENYTYPLIILESPKKLFDRPFNKKEAVYGAMVYINYKLGIPIIPTETERETARVIIDLAQKIQEDFSSPKIDQQDLNFSQKLTCSREDQSFFIQGLVDTGVVKANRLLNVLRTPEFLFHAIESTEIEYTRGGNPKAIRGIMEKIQGIGVKYIDRNQRLLIQSYNKNKKTNEKTRR